MKKLLLILFTFSFFLSENISSQTWKWAKSGAASSMFGNSSNGKISTDSFGNSYVTGYFKDSTFILNNIVLLSVNKNVNTLYLAKIDANGNVLWAKTLGGNDDIYGISVYADNNGVLLSGNFESTILFNNNISLTSNGLLDIFVAKFDLNGNVVWAKSAGGLQNDYSFDITMDINGNIFLCGSFQSPTISFGNIVLTHYNGTNVQAGDLYIVKYDSNGNPIWSQSAGGNRWDAATSLSTDANGNIYVTGRFSSSAISFGTNVLYSANNTSFGWM